MSAMMNGSTSAGSNPASLTNFMNIKEKLQKLIKQYELDISFYDNGGYYFQECEYECDRAKASKLEEVVIDLKEIIKDLN